MRWLLERQLEILEAAGAKKIWRLPVEDVTFTVHIMGTARMGNDPKRSVVNRDHPCHDLAKLFLVDGSSFVTSARQQPTATFHALAFRGAARWDGSSDWRFSCIGIQRRSFPLTATLPILRSVVICPTVQAKLCQLAFDVFTSRPGEGESIGGVLLGKSGPAGLEVTDFWQGVENRTDVVGYWSIRRRVTHTLNGTGVLVVVAPVSVHLADALVWQRDAAGKETEGHRMTFQMERRGSKRDDRRAEMKKVSNGYGWGWAAACILLAAAGLKVRLKAQEVVVRLRVRRQEQPVIARTAAYLEPLRAKAHREAGGGGTSQ